MSLTTMMGWVVLWINKLVLLMGVITQAYIGVRIVVCHPCAVRAALWICMLIIPFIEFRCVYIDY